MIRLFTALCKTLLAKLSEEQAFLAATREFDPYGASCPRCRAIGKLSDYDVYERNHVTIADDIMVETRVSVRRVECSSCGSTHALLPDTLIPYNPYTLVFKLSVLIAYFERDTTVEKVCERFEIAVSALVYVQRLSAKAVLFPKKSVYISFHHR